MALCWVSGVSVGWSVIYRCRFDCSVPVSPLSLGKAAGPQFSRIHSVLWRIGAPLGFARPAV